MARLDSIRLLKERIVRIKAAPEKIAREAAPVIQAMLRHDATTKRGNVPSFGDRGNVPITATAHGPEITVSAPDWVLKLAQEKGQVDEWAQTVQTIAGEAMQ